MSVNDRAFNYGDGLFETIRVKSNNPLFIDDHIKRLKRGCKILHLPVISNKLIKESVTRSISNTKDCIIKIIYSRGLSDHGYNYNKDICPQLYVIKKLYNKGIKKSFIKLGFSGHTINNNSYLSKIKHLNRIDQVLGTTLKSKKKYDEYILCNSKNDIIECISSNIFFYNLRQKNYTFFTPDLTNCGVEGIMKQQIIKTLKRNKFIINEKVLSKRDIIKFQGCLICNVVKGVQFVNKIENRNIKHDVLIEDLLKKYIYE